MQFRVFCDPEAAESPDEFGLASIAIETPHGDLDIMKLLKPNARFRSKEDVERLLAETFDVPLDRISVDLE